MLLKKSIIKDKKSEYTRVKIKNKYYNRCNICIDVDRYYSKSLCRLCAHINLKIPGGSIYRYVVI